MEHIDFTELCNMKNGIVKIGTPYCGKCKMLTPIFEKLETSNTIKTFDIDGEMYPEVAEKFNVRNVPVILLFKNNEIIFRNDGYMSYNDLVSVIESNT